jgi:glycine cleavage system aminomethyltransferase T
MPIRIEGAQAPAPGTKLTMEDKAVAEISAAVYSPGLGEIAALAYVRTEAAEAKRELTVAGSDPPQRARIVQSAGRLS